MELLKPLYGLSDSGDSWAAKLRSHIIQALGLNESLADPPISFLHDENMNLIGIHATYVDDLLRAGNKTFKRICKITHETFETSEDEVLPLTYAGFHISR